MVKINRYTAVQDCGLIINPRLAESQIYGAIIMGISTALYEERIMDDATGRMLNSDYDFYKLAGIKDIGDIVVHLDIREVNDKRGVIGLGEPPAIGHLRRGRQRRRQCHRRPRPQNPHDPNARARMHSKGGTPDAVLRICQSGNRSRGRGAARPQVGRGRRTGRRHGSPQPA